MEIILREIVLSTLPMWYLKPVLLEHLSVLYIFDLLLTFNSAYIG